MVKFTRINVFPKDYQVLLSMFSEEDARPAQGVLIQRALHHIDELEKEIVDLKDEHSSLMVRLLKGDE